MALQVWLPLHKDLRNQGIANVTATATGAVTLVNGDKLGQCYQFGTATGRITLPASTMTSFTECTVAFWVKVLGWQTSWDTFFQAGLGSSPWNSYTFGILRNQGNSLCFAISDGSSSTQGNCKTSNLTLNTWYHVAFSYKSGHMYTYVNGVLTQDYSTSIVPNFAGITYISIGQLGNATSYQTNCQMSNFRIYNNALSAQEIAKLSGKVPKGLLIWHPFNKDTHNQGVLRTANFSANNLTENASGKLGKCYGGGAIYHYTEEVIGNVWTLACWVKSSGWGQYNDILLCKNTDSSDNCQFYMSVVGGNTFNIGVNGGSSTSQYSYTFAINTWYHLCCTYDGVNIKQYLNGVLVKTTAYSSAQKTGLYNIGINCRSTNTAGTGTTGTGSNYLNDVRIYDSCLSPEQVKWLSKGLVLHWRLDNNGWGNENIILTGNKITSSSGASGITPTVQSDGSLKVVSTSGNGNWCTVSFASNSNTNVGNKMSVGDKYTLSVECKVESGTVLPNVFINSGNSYKRLTGNWTQGKWCRVYYTSTWADPGSGYGNISLHLGMDAAIGTYYFRNFKLEKGEKATAWSPAPADNVAGIAITKEHDGSGFGYDGTKTGTFGLTSDSPKYGASSTFNGSNHILNTDCVLTNPVQLTAACWAKPTNANINNLFTCSYTGDYWQLTIATGGTLEVRDNATSWNGTRKSYTLPSVTAGEWVYIVVTYDAGTVKIYKNGVLQSTNTTGGANLNTLNLWRMGNSQSTLYNGLASDFRIYATALSANDVLALYNNEAALDTSTNPVTVYGKIR